MKYIVILGDGMSDYPVPALGGKTPLECASKPDIDYLAKNGELGMAKTIPDGMPMGSDVANLSVMGYNPKEFYSGRSPLEAVSIGIKLSDSDVTFRCNLVTLSDNEPYEIKTMVDYSSDEITTNEARQLINFIDNELSTKDIHFFAGVSYRHCMVYNGTHTDYVLTPPHDILERKISEYLPKGDNSGVIYDLMKKSFTLLKDHPINKDRIKRGLRPANSIWLWGQGTKPAIPLFYDKYKKKGAVISAVDLIKGIGICGGMKIIDVQGATGNINTNFWGKAQAAIKELKGDTDFVYLHIEAPDECGHRQEIDNKVKSIELIDSQVVRPIMEGLSGMDYSILLMPDHPTPLMLRTHTSDPVPYILYRSNKETPSGATGYTEKEAEKTKVFVAEGHKLLDKLLNS